MGFFFFLSSEFCQFRLNLLIKIFPIFLILEMFDLGIKKLLPKKIIGPFLIFFFIFSSYLNKTGKIERGL